MDDSHTQMPQLEENIDYYDSFMKTTKKTWNVFIKSINKMQVSIMSAYEFLCKYLTHEDIEKEQNQVELKEQIGDIRL